MASLDTILKGSSSRGALVSAQAADTDAGSVVDEVEVSADTPVEEPKTEPKVETPKTDAPGEKKASSPEAKDEPTIPLKTFKDVERRLQQAERQLKEREKPAEPVKTPDVVEDPEGFKKHIESNIDDKLLDRVVLMSEGMTKRAHADFAEVMGTNDEGQHMAWIDLVKDNPSLIAKFRAADNPVQFAYDTVKRHKAMSEIGDPTQYRSNLEKELRAKWEAETAAKAKTDAKRPEIPESLADEPSKGTRNAPAWTGPKPLKEIIGKKKT